MGIDPNEKRAEEAAESYLGGKAASTLRMWRRQFTNGEIACSIERAMFIDKNHKKPRAVDQRVPYISTVLVDVQATRKKFQEMQARCDRCDIYGECAEDVDF